MKRLHWLGVVFFSAAALTVITRRADACGAPGDYLISVDANTVHVTSQRPCESASPLLRQNIDTGEVVRVERKCEGGWYVDSCVPRGAYRYGYETPLVPSDANCTCGPYEYFGVAVVSVSDTTCVSADAVDLDGVPWADQPTICTPSLPCSSDAPGASCVASTDGGGDGGGPVPSAGGCSSAPEAPSPAGVVLMLALLQLAIARSKRERSA